MMTSIFTSFDMAVSPYGSPSFSYFYSLLPTIMFMQSFWMQPPTRHLLTKTLTLLSISLSNPTSGRHLKAITSITLPILYLLTTLNLNTTLPFLPSPSTHLTITMSAGLPFWFTLIIFSISNKIKKAKAHYLPENSPQPIASFLATVEVLSSYIRPITLSFRLAANMSAGHVILGMLMSSIVLILLTTLLSLTTMIPFLMANSYAMFELMICLVQAFVFTLLATMYTSDYVPH